MRFLRCIGRALLAIAVAGGIAAAQSKNDFYKPDLPKARIAIAELPDDYHAMTLRENPDSGFGDIFTGPYGMMMLMGGMRSSGDSNEGEQKMLRFMDASAISFTRGDTTEFGGTKYLITYKIVIEASHIESVVQGHQKPELELVLVRSDTIKTIVPKPDMTRVAFEALFSNTAPTLNTEDAKTKTLSNFKQLALGTIIYCSDYDDVTPYAQDTKSVFAVCQPYLKNTAVTKTFNPNNSEPRYNMAISGVSMTDVPAPADIPLFYESAAWPDGSRCVSFCDGHAKFVDATEWDRLKAALQLKLKHTGKPLPPFYWKQLHYNDSLAGAQPTIEVPAAAPAQRAVPPPVKGTPPSCRDLT